MNIALETKRLYLRPFELRDSIHLYQMNKDPEVIRYTGDPPFSSHKEAEKLIREYDQYEKYHMGRLGVFLKDTETFLGWCGLKYHVEEKLVDVGYRFYRKYWGYGYATESSKASIAFGFDRLHLKKIYAHAHTDNHASQKVLEKCGLRYIKSIVYDALPAKLFCITKDDYEQLKELES